MVGSSTFTKQKGRKNREKVQNRVGRKTQEAAESQETPGKRAETKKNSKGGARNKS